LIPSYDGVATTLLTVIKQRCAQHAQVELHSVQSLSVEMLIEFPCGASLRCEKYGACGQSWRSSTNERTLFERILSSPRRQTAIVRRHPGAWNIARVLDISYSRPQ
jgi:hypothetical protein